MPFTPHVRGRAFDPETLRCMGAAFDAASARLGLKGEDDLFTRALARESDRLCSTGR